MRDAATYDLFEEAGLVAAETAFYEIYLDYGDGPVSLGLYTMIEVVDDTVIDRYFDDNNGNIYEGDGPAASLTKAKSGNKVSRWGERMDRNEPLIQAIETMKAFFQLLHGRLRETDTLVIEFGNPLDERLLSAPGQGLGEVEDGVETVHQGTIPMLFQAAPYAFNRIVLAVIRWVVS
jgi:hypothetical protein